MIKHTFRAITLVALCAFAATSHAATTIKVQLEGIGDGDTIYVRDVSARASYRVRLAMIDAPESSQAYGPQAKSALKQLLRGAGTITLHVDGSDRYGRLIALVVDERQRNINLEMVNQGAAWVYSQYAQRGSFSSQFHVFQSAEQQARIRQLGLWREANPIEPWRFRR